jgi:hypothetical protein
VPLMSVQFRSSPFTLRVTRTFSLPLPRELQQFEVRSGMIECNELKRFAVAEVERNQPR